MQTPPVVPFPPSSRPSTPRQAAMSGERPPSSSSLPPQQPEPFRFWLPYRSSVGSWRHQPRPPSPAPPPRTVPSSSSPRPQPPPPPPSPAGPAHQRPAPHPHATAEVEDIPLQAESSDESDAIPVQSSDSSQLRLRGGRPSTADIELTLSGADDHEGQRPGGDDTKIAISGFPRSRLFDGARAPYRREIEDGLRSLAVAARETPASGQGYRVITLAGHNVGASMVLGSGGPTEPPLPVPGPGSRVAANVNSNVQSVNNSSMEESTCTAGDPGVHVDIKNAREEPAAVTAATPSPTPMPREEEKPKEPVPVRRPPLVVTPQQRPARPRRCLRALMMENGSDTEAARKPRPRPRACRFQCVTDHAPTASDGDKNADDGGRSSMEGAS